MYHSCPNLVSTSFLYNPYIPFVISRNFLFTRNYIAITPDSIHLNAHAYLRQILWRLLSSRGGSGGWAGAGFRLTTFCSLGKRRGVRG